MKIICKELQVNEFIIWTGRQENPIPYIKQIPCVEHGARVGVGHASRYPGVEYWQLLEAQQRGDVGVFGAGAVALGLVGDVGLVGDIDLHRQDVADLGARWSLKKAREPLRQSEFGVGRRLRRRHRHPHWLVARLCHRVLDRRQLRRLADILQAVDGGTPAQQRCRGRRQQHGTHHRKTFHRLAFYV